MTVYFSKIVDRYFRQWINLPTWDSMHPFDMTRFYQFLKAFQKYSRNRSLTRIRRNIIRAAHNNHPELDNEYIEEVANFFTTQAGRIFAFQAAQFPDPLVEMRNPYQVSLYLRTLRKIDDSGESISLYTHEEIEGILAENFGTNWREQ